jgi:rhodanese-related sulfurtransferase
MTLCENARANAKRLSAVALALVFAAFWAAPAPARSQATPAAGTEAKPRARAELDSEFQGLVAKINNQTGSKIISAADLKAKLARGEKVVLLDIREPRENEVSSLPGARLVVPDKVDAETLAGVPPDATVVTYCTAGLRSGMAAVDLEHRLNRPVYTLSGGIIAWFNEGGEVRDPAGKPVNRIDAWGEPWTSYVHPR